MSNLDTTKLDKFIKACKTAPKAKIGILNDAKRKDSDLSNAEVGAGHEFGTENLPQRSFLRVPLTEHLSKFLDNSKAFDKDALPELIQEKSLKPWVDKIAIISQSVVMEAFASQGFGKWPHWQAPGYKNKTGMLLQDTLQLRNSITYEVVE